MQNPEKDPEDWTTGEEPMTGRGKSYSASAIPRHPAFLHHIRGLASLAFASAFSPAFARTGLVPLLSATAASFFAAATI